MCPEVMRLSGFVTYSGITTKLALLRHCYKLVIHEPQFSDLFNI